MNLTTTCAHMHTHTHTCSQPTESSWHCRHVHVLRADSLGLESLSVGTSLEGTASPQQPQSLWLFDQKLGKSYSGPALCEQLGLLEEEEVRGTGGKFAGLWYLCSSLYVKYLLLCPLLLSQLSVAGQRKYQNQDEKWPGLNVYRMHKALALFVHRAHWC